MTTSDATLLTVHLLVTAAMVGLIWFVQVVHYPLFASVGRADFVAYENAHTRLTAFVVGPFMAVEGATAIWLAVVPPPGVDRWLAIVALGVLGVVQMSTVVLQVPQHSVLSVRHDADRIRRLVVTNWVRTFGWSVRAVLASVMLVAAVTA
jgi:hypothetical protein